MANYFLASEGAKKIGTRIEVVSSPPRKVGGLSVDAVGWVAGTIPQNERGECLLLIRVLGSEIRDKKTIYVLQEMSLDKDECVKHIRPLNSPKIGITRETAIVTQDGVVHI